MAQSGSQSGGESKVLKDGEELILFIRDTCPKCQVLKSRLRKEGKIIEELNIDTDSFARRLAKKMGILEVPKLAILSKTERGFEICIDELGSDRCFRVEAEESGPLDRR